MMHCPICRTAAHARTSRYLSGNTKERYRRSQNINCSCTFMTLESSQRRIVARGKVEIAPPHPTRGNQGALWI